MTFKTKLFGGLTVIAIVGAPAVTTAEVTATDAFVIMNELKGYGLEASMDKDEQGDPKIISHVSDSDFFVYFWGCEDNKNCTSVMFKAAYDLKVGISALKINEWNQENRFAKAYIDDEGDPIIEMDVNLAYDGVGEKNFGG
ncbi:YbjN domain-containing protein [Profundibacter sp.]|uniref:YbjN domain-containing protein n=1 Tax=Profundibacter sp. TaxID=3101071 RepID=UPI003D14C106